jgi:hypothetical protein
MPPTTTLQEKQLQLLEQIQVTSFAASPAQVQPFEKTTISWQIKLPAGLNFPFQLAINGRTVHGLQGSTTFQVSTTTEFDLVASTNLQGVSVNIASVTVTADQAECRAGSIPATVLRGEIITQLNAAFEGRLRDLIVVKPDVGTIAIDIPLTLGDPKTMDIHIDLFPELVAQTPPISVGSDVTVKVDLHESPGDFGCGNGMAEVVQPFMLHIVDHELVPALVQGVMDEGVTPLISSSQQQDRFHRQFQLTSIAMTADGFAFTVCPTTPGLVTHIGSSGSNQIKTA